MRESGSPFLHRDEEQRRHPYRYQQFVAQREKNMADRERARYTLEKLRYRWWLRTGHLSSFMQSLGDWGRQYGMDPRRIGIRWW